MKHCEIGEVLENEEIAADIWRMRVSAPAIAAEAAPGQFVHVRIPRGSVQFLRMPFAVASVHPKEGSVEICYQVVGQGTRQLTGLSVGAYLDLIGPVGNGWSIPDSVDRSLLVAGGVGTPALTMLGRDLAKRGVCVDVVLGAQSKDRFACLSDMRAVCEQSGGRLYLTTDDGSVGTHGFATAESTPLIESGDYGYVAVCGPYPMMRAVVAPALDSGMKTQVSMEKLMACGVGACLSCVVDTRSGKRRCCVDGPVFNAEEVVWL